LFTFLDGNGNETINTNFDLKVSKNDGVLRTYSYDFSGLWNLNNPAVSSTFIKSLRIYMLPGQGAFQLDTIKVFNSKKTPTAPFNLSASVNGQGNILLSWADSTNATTFNLYKTNNLAAAFSKVKSAINTSDVPYVLVATDPITYYKVSGVNAIGESSLSTEIEVIANITGVEPSTHLPVSVYPNPCSGKFFIQTNGKAIDNLKVFDATGKTQTFEVIKDASLMIVDLKTACSGIYFIAFNQESKAFVVKILID
jgi:hypothetical protein